MIGGLMNFGMWIVAQFRGVLVGMDEFGNNYYRSKTKDLNSRERRWVLYKSEPDGSLVPPEWHAWLHHTTDKPLIEAIIKQKEWHLDHLPNLTGTAEAYRPKGHAYKGGNRASSSSDYQSWEP